MGKSDAVHGVWMILRVNSLNCWFQTRVVARFRGFFNVSFLTLPRCVYVNNPRFKSSRHLDLPIPEIFAGKQRQMVHTDNGVHPFYCRRFRIVHFKFMDCVHSTAARFPFFCKHASCEISWSTWKIGWPNYVSALSTAELIVSWIDLRNTMVRVPDPHQNMNALIFCWIGQNSLCRPRGKCSAFWVNWLLQRVASWSLNLSRSGGVNLILSTITFFMSVANIF